MYRKDSYDMCMCQKITAIKASGVDIYERIPRDTSNSNKTKLRRNSFAMHPSEKPHG